MLLIAILFSTHLWAQEDVDFVQDFEKEFNQSEEYTAEEMSGASAKSQKSDDEFDGSSEVNSEKSTQKNELNNELDELTELSEESEEEPSDENSEDLAETDEYSDEDSEDLAEADEYSDEDSEDLSENDEDEDIESLLDDEFEEEPSLKTKTAQDDQLENEDPSNLDPEIAQDEESLQEIDSTLEGPIVEEALVEETIEPVMDPEPVEEESFQAEASEESNDYDEPNYEYEQALADIYSKFYSSPITEEQWSGLLQKGKQESYSIQSGDTLWGISSTIFGDGNYWPKIWSLNDQLFNPHLIKPNYKINFILGNESSSPSFTITDGSETNEVKTNTANNKNEEYYSESTQELNIVFPPPLFPYKPVVQTLPPSLPHLRARNSDIFDEAGITYGKRPVYDFKEVTRLDFVLFDGVPEPEAKIIEVEMGGDTASPYQYVYIEPVKGSLDIGELLTSYENIGRITYKDKWKNIKNSGFSIKYTGSIEVIERVTSNYKGRIVYKGLVKKAIFPVKKGSFLRHGKVKNVVLDFKKEDIKNISALIIGGRYTAERVFFSNNAIVYIDKGSDSGLAPGDILPIRKNRKERFKKSFISNDNLVTGYMKIAHVNPRSSTAVIMRAVDDIHIRDFTGVNNEESISGEILSDSEGIDDLDEDSYETTSADDFADEEEYDDSFEETSDEYEFDEGSNDEEDIEE